ncbi:MAG TPA: SNF2-related protein [Anaeromyxobacter sp.]|nr:SNF2-related protein [Anaeromyxobacter sp.]
MSSQVGESHPSTRFHQRVAAEALTLRGGGGTSRLAPALAHAAVDLNPHQIEAAAFALNALPTGGAVLADEVGLGKTIEAGLVLAQLSAEGRGRAIVLVPASLRAQWREELIGKFGLDAQVLDGDALRARERQGVPGNPFDREGVIIASHPFAAMHAAEIERVAWDVAVIDEAHRLRNAYRRDHRTGQALRRALRKTPKLLLTATPLQNDLLELVGLSSFIDEALLGNEDSFRLQYGTGELTEDQASDLKARLAPAVVRTLRRQVKEYVKFTTRRSIVEDFAPTRPEQELYDRVSEYLRREDAYAVPLARRALFLLVYRKILASSSFALAATLERLADGLERRRDGAADAAQADLALELDAFSEEAEELLDDGPGPTRPRRQLLLRRMGEELAELRACAKLARSIEVNAKGEALVRGLDRCFTVARACGWPEKAVVFTEFRRTQEYLKGLLTPKGYSVTCLSGEVAGTERRQSLVEEFRAKTQILLMTEAGAEGLNLQFCNLVVNYDLPWNPQRIEQRIGRCHRYGQSRDVLVLNFLNRQNAADARLFELLAQKLALFDGVFGSSDEILGALSSGIDFERRVLHIYQSCRSPDEVDRAFDKLRGELDGRISARLAAARALLFERFDGEVRGRLRLAEQRAREALERRRAEEDALLAAAEPGETGAPSPPEPSRGRRARMVKAAADRIRSRPQEAVFFVEIENRKLPAELAKLAGREGWWFVYRYALESLVPEERLVHLVLWFDGQAHHPLPPEEALAFAALPAAEARGGPRATTPSLGEAPEEALSVLQAQLLAELQQRSGAAYDASRERWDRAVEDALAGPRKVLEEARAAWSRARAALHDESPLPLRDLRALLERAERDYRRKLDDLRAMESARYGEKDRALAELKKRAEVKQRRTLVATAFWRCV